MTYDELKKERNQIVVKSNELIQKSRYSLSLNQQKLILYAISKIRPDDRDFQEYTFSIHDLCEVMGIDTNGANYGRFRESLKEIADKSCWVSFGNDEILFRWFTFVHINKAENTVSLRFDDFFKPYLLELKKNFTAYKLEYAISMKSKYSIRLYEWLKSRVYMGYAEVPLEGLHIITLSSYRDWRDFRKNVLEVAIPEINRLTDIVVGYKPIKAGRKIVRIGFTITQKGESEKLKAEIERYHILNTPKTKINPAQ